MNYVSTRNKSLKATAAEAIAKGISEEGGLFVPDTFKTLTDADFERIGAQGYVGRAKEILKLFLNDFTEKEIDYCASGAYTGSFDDEQPAPVVALDDTTNILELWHGPTCAFKDLALQLLPYLLTTNNRVTCQPLKLPSFFILHFRMKFRKPSYM